MTDSTPTAQAVPAQSADMGGVSNTLANRMAAEILKRATSVTILERLSDFSYIQGTSYRRQSYENMLKPDAVKVIYVTETFPGGTASDLIAWATRLPDGPDHWHISAEGDDDDYSVTAERTIRRPYTEEELDGAREWLAKNKDIGTEGNVVVFAPRLTIGNP